MRSFWRAFYASFVEAYRAARGLDCGCPHVTSDTIEAPADKWILWRASDGTLHTIKDSHHITGDRLCWCGPAFRCAACDAVGPCIHGPRRVEITVHKQAS